MFLYSLNDGKIETKEALTLLFSKYIFFFPIRFLFHFLLLVYLCYVAMVMVIYYNERNNKELKKYIDDYPEVSELLKSGNSMSGSSERLEELKSLITPNTSGHYHHSHGPPMIQKPDALVISPTNTNAVNPGPGSGSGKKRIVSGSGKPLVQSPVFLVTEDGKTNNNKNNNNMASFEKNDLEIAESDRIFGNEQFVVQEEDVEDAAPISRSANRFFERLFEQIQALISKPVRDFLKMLIPTLENDPNATTNFNLFNFVYFSIYVSSSQSSYQLISPNIVPATAAGMKSSNTSSANSKINNNSKIGITSSPKKQTSSAKMKESTDTTAPISSDQMNSGSNNSDNNNSNNNYQTTDTVSDNNNSNNSAVTKNDIEMAKIVTGGNSKKSRSNKTTVASSKKTGSRKAGGEEKVILEADIEEGELEEEDNNGEEDDALSIDSENKIPLWRAFLVVFTCIFGISCSASMIVFASESLIQGLGVDTSKMGVTLVAFGSEVRDF
jgi:Ca2+/Na+ antiporter